ncbi:MAG: integrase core domain-containing protein [Planctomycetota bacterium]|jgi:transposase InsO family protein
MPPILQFLLLIVSGWVNRRQQDVIEYLKAENRVLREQLGGRRPRLTNDQRRRLAVKGEALGRKVLMDVASIVTPDTILRWYRTLIAKKYDGRARRGAGRPRAEQQIAALVVRIATENPRFGYTRIRDALGNLGYEIARSTVRRILAEHGIEPAPERRRRTPWKTFLKAHWGAIGAADFFTVEVLTFVGLVRYSVFFVIELKTRRVEIAGITAQPCETWMKQIARNLTDPIDGFLLNTRHLILDRDPLYTAAFRHMLKASGVNVVRLPARSPNLNAFAERFVLSIKSECLSRMVVLGERHLRTAIAEYMEHYHRERNHQGLGGRLLVPDAAPGVTEGPVVSRERLGGMLKYYFREAA